MTASAIGVARLALAGAAAIAILGTGACAELATPDELARAHILAVRAEPPALAPGERARLDVLVAGPEGEVEPALIRWDPALVEVDGDGAAWFVAPEVGGGAAQVEVTATVVLADGTEVTAIKAVTVGARLGAANPTITALQVAAAIPAGGVATLDGTVSPAPGEEAIFMWHTTAGTIPAYRRAPTELEAPDEPTSGTVFLVYRDGLGGVAWRSAEVAIQ